MSTSEIRNTEPVRFIYASCGPLQPKVIIQVAVCGLNQNVGHEGFTRIIIACQ